MIKKLTMPIWHFKEIFEDFEVGVKTKQLNPIEYSLWRQLHVIANYDKQSEMLEFEIYGENPEYIALVKPWNRGPVGTTEDNSLGEQIIYNYQLEYEDYTIQRKEDVKDMKKNFGFEFGTCEYDNVRISMYGLAVKNAAGVYVSYNPTTKEIVDVDIMNFEGGKFLFKMPVGIKEIKAGDVILHNRKPIIVTEVGETDILVVDVVSGENKSIMLTRNMFGFNFATKIVSLFNAIGEAPTPDAPFGNLLPFMLLGDESTDADPMTMALLAMSMNGKGMDMSNPMWMYFLCKDNANMKDIAPLMLMSMNK